MDAMDAALVDFSQDFPKQIASYKLTLSDELRAQLIHLCRSDSVNIKQFAELDQKIAYLSVDAVEKLLKKTAFVQHDVLAIGSHGQTVFHYPRHSYPFTMQIGDPNIIAEKTGITTIAYFRRRDIAAGGQGAPLTPAFHRFVFRSPAENRIILNLGGIANITYLPADANSAIVGYDTGPANLLMDQWTQKHLQQRFDKEGAWAASAAFDETLLQQFLTDPYFHLAPPKSTGREYFNLTWLAAQLAAYKQPLSPANIQATLCELTAASVGLAIQQLHHSQHGRLILCGGGSKNIHLKKRLAAHCPNCHVQVSDDLGISAEWLEAIAFAWFAKQTLEGKTSNLPEVTGAKTAAILGGIYLKN
jgi:anhydro-N-acetylmuramic acid kinase